MSHPRWARQRVKAYITVNNAKATATASPMDEPSQGTSCPKAFQHLLTEVS
jgi:hypothetical protein